jgi:L-fuculose-phosphate aldolase
MTDPRPRLCEIARLAYDRRLLDSAGGNFSVRFEDRIYCTPRYSGSKRQWRLSPEEIVVLDLEGRKQEGAGEISREARMHVAIYQAFPEVGGVCHAHPQNVLVFASLRRPIPPTSEQTEKYGVIELAEEAPAHSEALAKTVVDTLARKREKLAKHAIACLLPYHGITVAGRDLEDAYDALERIDGSCYILIGRAALERAGS